MAYKGYCIETQIAAKNIESLNRSAKAASVDFDGGNLVKLSVGTDDCWVATVPATATGLSGLWIAYNPSEYLTVVNGKQYAGLSADPRDYTNIATRPFTVFKPQLGDLVGFTKECFDASLTDQIVAGKFFESKDAQATFAVVNAATADHTAFVITKISTLPFPRAGVIGMERQVVVYGECVQV